MLLPDIMNGINLLAEDLDRLLRQPRDGEDLIDAVEQSGASARSLSGSLTLTHGGTDTERMIARIMAATANKASPTPPAGWPTPGSGTPGAATAAASGPSGTSPTRNPRPTTAR